MCLSAPAQILEIGDPAALSATVQLGEMQRTVSIGFLAGTGLTAGDWVLVQAGIALRKIDAEDAASILDQLLLVEDALAELSAADTAARRGRAEQPRPW